MSVYVDDMQASYGRMVMCHMIADSSQELIAMALKIGVHPKWIQCHGTYKEHFDICLAKKTLALKNGALQVTQIELARKLVERRKKP